MEGRAGAATSDRVVGEVRAFNRFWTKAIGVLNAGLLESEYSLTEVRVLFELTRRSSATLTELGDELRLDAGYLSRILNRFKRNGLVVAAPSETDGRRQLLRVSKEGAALMKKLDRRADREITTMLRDVAVEDQQKLVKAMGGIRRILDPELPPAQSFVIRPLRPGDIGWVLERHGTLYTAEYGFDEQFEALVATVLAGYAQRRDSRLERGWIAEIDGERAGSIFCMRKSKRVAQLRLLLVEPCGRRLGIGTKLVDECMSFARRAGYAEMVLWTKDVLHDARRLYQRAGFQLTAEDEVAPGGGAPRGQHWRVVL